MKRMALQATMLLVAVALGGLAPAMAAAEEFPSILPLPTVKEPLTYTSTSGHVTLATASTAIECESATSAGGFTTIRSGEVGLTLSGCSSLGAKCTTAGDAAGVVLLTAGLWHLWDYKIDEMTFLSIIPVYLFKSVTIPCGVLKVELRGAVMGQMTGVTTLTKTKTATVRYLESKGVQEFKECELPKESCEGGKKYLLELNFGKGFAEAGLAVEQKVTFGKEAEFHF